jgi:hypothetical protein
MRLRQRAVRKVHHGETVGKYGDFIVNVTEDAAKKMEKKYPAVVRIN